MGWIRSSCAMKRAQMHMRCCPERIIMHHRWLTCATACLLSLLSTDALCAEPAKSYFQRLLRIIIPFAPGGGQDTTARILAPKLTEITGQQVIVDNRPGGAGIIAAETLLKAPA